MGQNLLEATPGHNNTCLGIRIAFINPFNPWCPLKGHTYINKPGAESCRFV